MQVIKLHLWGQIQFFINMITTTLSIYYSVSFFPADHHQLESFGTCPGIHSNLDSLMHRDKQSYGQIIRNFFAFVLESEMVSCNFLWEIDFEVIVKSLKVEGTVMKMIHHNWQLIRLIDIFNFLQSEWLVYLEEAKELASLQNCLTHYMFISKNEIKIRDAINQIP